LRNSDINERSHGRSQAVSPETLKPSLIVVLAHPQQALEIIDLPRGRTYHRLEGKEQTVLVQRIPNRLPDRRITPLPAWRRRAVMGLRRTSHHAAQASLGARY
jgi:hypothetical protein